MSTTKTETGPTLEQKLTVLKLLFKGRGLVFVQAAVKDLTDEQIRLIATSHGYPDADKMGKAKAAIERQLDERAKELPESQHREPVSAVPAFSDTPPRPNPAPAAAEATLVSLPLDQVKPSPNNPRERMTGIQDLAQSIKEAGLIQPIVVQKQPGNTSYQIVAGHRRHAAVKLIGWPKIAAIIRREMLPDQELVTMLVENGQRAGLDPIEEARAINRMCQQMRIMKVDVAKKIGRSYGYVNDRLTLLSLSPEEQEQIRAGHMSLTGGRVKAKIASGRVRPGAKGRAAPGHLTAGHTLAARAKARCLELKHSRGKGVGVGGVACGECWESVIRADEREHLHDESNRLGRCVLCDTHHDPDRLAS